MKLNYRPDIDGLRAIAVLAVIIFHLNKSWLHGGFIGVDIFFVISGFLITKIIYTDIINNSFSFKEFYQRRIKRILPLFFFVMFATFIGAYFILLPEDFLRFTNSLKSTTYFWQNMWFAKKIGGYWDAASETLPLLHTWSLAVEEQFYIILPIILLILYKVGVRTKGFLVILFILALVSFALAQFSGHSAFLSKYNYYSLITGRAGELLIGSIAAILSIYDKNEYSLRTCNILTILGFLGVALSYIFISEKILFPSFIAVIPTLSAVIIIYFGHKRAYISRFLSLQPIVYIGLISYSLYLWHWPIISLSKQYFFIDKFTLLQALIAVMTTFTLSILSYRYIETPFRYKRPSFGILLAFYCLIPVLLILLVSYLNQKTNGSFYRFTQESQRQYSIQKEYLNKNSNFCHYEIKDNCIFGDTTKEPTVLLLGDSHAGHYSPYIDEAGKAYKFAVKIVTSNSCLFIPQQTKFIREKQNRENCIQKTNDINNHIKKFNTIIIAGMWQSNRYGEARKVLDNDFKNYIVELRNQNKNVILLGQIPYLDKKEYSKCSRTHLFYGYCDNSKIFSNSEIAMNNILKEISKNHNIVFFNPLDSLSIKQKKKWPIYQNFLAYKDQNHLNEHTTRMWSKEVLPKQKEFWESIVNTKKQ